MCQLFCQNLPFFLIPSTVARIAAPNTPSAAYMPPWLTSPVFTLALFEVFTPSESDLLAPVFAVLTFWLPDPPALFPAICWPAPPCAPFPFWFVLSCAPFPLWSAFPFWFPFGAVCLTCKAFIALTTAFFASSMPFITGALSAL